MTLHFITEPGVVAAIDADCLWVQTVQKSTCDTCVAEKGCGQSLIARWGGRDSSLRVLLEGRDASEYSVGDAVCVGVPEDVVVRGSLFVYMIPLLGLLLGVFFADYLSFSEHFVVLSAFLGFVLGAMMVRLHSYLYRNDRRSQPVLMDDLSPVRLSNR